MRPSSRPLSLAVLLAAATAAAPPASGALPAAAPAQTRSRTTKATEPEVEIEPREWEHDDSDLAPDEIYQFGALANGLRFVWFKNSNPPNAVFLRLHVDIGSLVEDESELGMAHFVEHMAFNGTSKFKAGTLVQTFNKEGIKFGSDINAHTGLEETVYELDLPDAEPKRLETALLWMRDVACGLKMDDKEVQAEKGVIDAEQRDRDSKGFRLFVDQMAKIGDGLRHPTRLPIGTQEVRAKFTGKSCLAFYKRWYRPEHMTFILAGDLGDLDPEALIRKHFGTIPAAKGEPPERPDLGEPTFRHKGFAIESGGSHGAIHVAKLRACRPKRDDIGNLLAAIPLDMALIVVGNRLEERQEKEKLPFLGAGAERYDFEQRITGPRVTVACEAGRWRDALTALERELRRLLDEGCTEDEAREAWTEFQRRLVPRPISPAPHTIEHLQQLMTACNLRYVPTADRARKEAMRPGTRGMTAEVLTRALREEWGQGELVIWTEGGIDLGADPQAELFELWNAAKGTDLAQPMTFAAAEEKKEGETEGDAAGDAADAGKPKADAAAYAYALKEVVRDPSAKITRHDDLRVVDLTLKNGARVLYRKSDGDVRGFGRWQVRVGEGASALPPEKHAVAWVAGRCFLAGGLAKNDWDTVRAAGGAVSFDVEADALVFSGGGIFGADPRRAFEVVCAYLTDPGFRQEPWDEWKKQLDEEFKDEEEGKIHLGTLMRRFQDEVRSGEPRLERPAKAAVAAVTLDEVKAFLKSQLDGRIEITAAGVDAARFEKALFSTFSTLPARRAAQPDVARATIRPLKTGLQQRHEVQSEDRSAHVRVLFPCPDAIEAPMARKLALLEDVVADRLRVEIREKRGGAYSPQGSVWGSDEWRGLGWVSLDVQVDPAKADEMAKACVTVMEELGTKGITQAELDRLRTARLGSVDATLKDYDVWFEALRQAHLRPQVIDEMRAYAETMKKIPLAEMNALAKQVFAKGRANVFVGIPK